MEQQIEFPFDRVVQVNGMFFILLDKIKDGDNDYILLFDNDDEVNKIANVIDKKGKTTVTFIEDKKEVDRLTQIFIQDLVAKVESAKKVENK